MSAPIYNVRDGVIPAIAPSAPITEAHLELAKNALFSRDAAGRLLTAPMTAQLIADSEAAAVQIAMLREYGNLCATNESLATERDQLRAETERLTAACDKFSNSEIAQGDWKARAERAEAELATERARLDDLVADLNDACITLASACDDCDDYALLNTRFKLTAVRDVLLQYIPNAAMKEGAK
jgi:hypothetical protein